MYLHYEDPQFDEEGQALYATHVIFDKEEDGQRQLLIKQLQTYAAELVEAHIGVEERKSSIYIDKSVSKEALYRFMNYGPPLEVGAPNPKTVTEEIEPDSRYL